MSRFSQIPAVNLQRSSFDRSSNLKTTITADYLYPIFVDEVLPGDTFNLKMSTFGRISTPITALMDNIYLDFFFFFVPNRLVWTNFQKFMGEQASPGDSTAYIMPTSTSPGASGAGTGYAGNSLHDYMGLPTRISALTHQNLPLRGYNLIWNSWFKDQNQQNAITVDLGDGPDTYSNYQVRQRGARHDYFTSCLPWPQKGTAVQLAPLVTRVNNAPDARLYHANTNTFPPVTQPLSTRGADGVLLNDALTQGYSLDPNGGLQAITTINQLRESLRLQEFYEIDARGGTRYIEMNLAHFGVVSDDLRATRPVYLGGGSSMVNIHPVPQTSVTAATPQGNLASFGTQSAQGIGFSKSFTEHGYIIGIVCARADQTYQQGMHKMWSRSTRVDHYFPAFANLGEQAVLSKEIFADGTAGDSDVFGYQERWSEYRFKESNITGKMRSNTSGGGFDINHLAQSYSVRPSLGGLIPNYTPMSRVLAVPSEPHFFLDCAFDLTCARAMPMYSVPGSKGSF